MSGRFRTFNRTFLRLPYRRVSAEFKFSLNLCNLVLITGTRQAEVGLILGVRYAVRWSGSYGAESGRSAFGRLARKADLRSAQHPGRYTQTLASSDTQPLPVNGRLFTSAQGQFSGIVTVLPLRLGPGGQLTSLTWRRCWSDWALPQRAWLTTGTPLFIRRYCQCASAVAEL